MTTNIAIEKFFGSGVFQDANILVIQKSSLPSITPSMLNTAESLLGAIYNDQGYQITFNSPQGAYGQIQLTVIDYQLFHISIGPYAGDYIATIPCGSTSFRYDANGNLVGFAVTSPVVIDHTVKCPSVNSNICNLKILSHGNVVFQTEGNCPVTFTVACGDECPDGYCKIDCEQYPGYCCINEAEIKSLSNQLR